MTIASADREVLKSVLEEMLQEKNSLLKEVIKEILVENQVIVSDKQAERRKQLKAIIEDDFEKYDEVFRALA